MVVIANSVAKIPMIAAMLNNADASGWTNDGTKDSSHCFSRTKIWSENSIMLFGGRSAGHQTREFLIGIQQEHADVTIRAPFASM